MADSQDDALGQLLHDCQVQDTFADAILDQGWTVDHFGMMDSDNDLRDVLGASFGALTPFQKAAVKLVWSKCQGPTSPVASPVEPASKIADSGASSSWTEPCRTETHFQCCCISQKYVQEELPC